MSILFQDFCYRFWAVGIFFFRKIKPMVIYIIAPAFSTNSALYLVMTGTHCWVWRSHLRVVPGGGVTVRCQAELSFVLLLVHDLMLCLSN